MHGIKVVEAFHESTRPSNCSLPWESGAEDARTPDASRVPGVSEAREAFGVRPIYRRFPSGAGRPDGSWSQCTVIRPRGLSMKRRDKAGRPTTSTFQLPGFGLVPRFITTTTFVASIFGSGEARRGSIPRVGL